MDSKLEPFDSPPSYHESQGTGSSSRSNDKGANTSSDGSTPHLYSSQIQQQLSSLASTIASLQTQRSLLAHAQDQKILSILTSHIQFYLSEFAKSGLTKGTLILVPHAGLKDETAVPFEFVDRTKQYDRVVRLGDKDDQHLTAFHRARQEFGYGYQEEEETGDLLFWRDEDMAERLATYLKPARPVREPRVLELPPRIEETKVVTPQAKPSSSLLKSFWGRKKEAVPPPVVEEAPPVDIKRQVEEERVEEKVVMDVKAEEVYFRTENDFGILGSKTGYGIVLRLRVELD